MERASQPIGYEFTVEKDARACAAELDRRFTNLELRGLRVYRIVWNGNFLVEATFSGDTPESRIGDARALLGEAGSPVHSDDLADYRKATDSGAGLPAWIRRIFGDG